MTPAFCPPLGSKVGSPLPPNPTDPCSSSFLPPPPQEIEPPGLRARCSRGRNLSLGQTSQPGLVAQSGGSQGLHDKHWQEVTHNASATLGEAVVSSINKLLGEVTQAAILLRLYMFFPPWQQVPRCRGFQLSPQNMLQRVKGRSRLVIKGTRTPSGGPALASRDTLLRAVSQGLSGQALGVGGLRMREHALCSLVCRQV